VLIDRKNELDNGLKREKEMTADVVYNYERLNQEIKSLSSKYKSMR